MEWLKNFEWTPLNAFKVLIGLLVFLLAFSFAAHLFNPMGLSLWDRMSIGFSNLGMHSGVTSMMDGPMYDQYDEYGAMGGMMHGDADGYYYDDHYYDDVMMYESSLEMPMMDRRNVPPVPAGSIGADAEEYEVKRYSATIRPSDSQRACAMITALKSHPYVVFELANESDRSCYFSFKVENEHVEEVLAVINELDPTDLSEQIETIKRQVDDLASRTEILERKLSMVNETLDSTVAAYDEFIDRATAAGDIESLAKLIDSKLSTVERLTEQRLNITAQLEQLARSTAEHMDQLEYTYFIVTINEHAYVDVRSIKESWKMATKRMLYQLNDTVQGLTLGLFGFLFVLMRLVLYFFILVLIGKLVWQTTLTIWKGK